MLARASVAPPGSFLLSDYLNHFKLFGNQFHLFREAPCLRKEALMLRAPVCKAQVTFPLFTGKGVVNVAESHQPQRRHANNAYWFLVTIENNMVAAYCR